MAEGDGLAMGGLEEFLARDGVGDLGGGVGGHESADGAVDEDVQATDAGPEEARAGGDAVGDRLAKDAGEVGRDVGVAGPWRLGVIAPSKERAQRASAGGVGEVQDAQVGVMDDGLARVGDEAVWVDGDVMGGDAGGDKVGYGDADGVAGGSDDMVAIGGVHARGEGVGSPEAHEVGRGMIVGGADDHVVELPGGGDALAHADDVVVEEADGVEGDEGNPGMAIVDGDGGGGEGVVDACGDAAIVEAGEPNGVEGVGDVRGDVEGGEACAEGARLAERGGGVEGEVDPVTGKAVAGDPCEACEDGGGKEDQHEEQGLGHAEEG